MHVITLLRADMFDINTHGIAGSIATIFPNWNAHDRLGVLIDEPLGGVGATHLIQIACTAFYDVKPSRRTKRKIYPEIYAIHVGKYWGSHVPYDFWPRRREALVAADHREVLDAINDRAITRLALPQRPVRALEHRRKEEDAALDRLVTTIQYHASGRVEQPDFSIAGKDRRTEFNPRQVLHAVLPPEPAPVPARGTIPVKEGDPDYRAWLLARAHDISAAERAAAQDRRAQLRNTAGLVQETYKSIAPADALKTL